MAKRIQPEIDFQISRSWANQITADKVDTLSGMQAGSDGWLTPEIVERNREKLEQLLALLSGEHFDLREVTRLSREILEDAQRARNRGN